MTASSGPSISSIDILLVEASPQDAEMTMRAFAKLHLAHRLTWVRDGAEAIDLIFGSPENPGAAAVRSPSLVLLDLKLPRVDGHEVLRRIKADVRTHHIPVVVLTSSREEADLERSYRNGANSYVVKPVACDSFVAAIQEVGLYWVLLNQPFDAGAARDSAPMSDSGAGDPFA